MNNHSFQTRRLALLVAACYAPGAFAAQAARVEFATSEPVIIGADGRERPARRGESVVPGDRVLTRAGRAQLAFTDGAFVSLQPNTDFGVTEYSFSGANDGKEKSVMSLVRGALRTVTGLIGRSKRDAYVMHTPSATIGIRGTGGRIEVNDQGTLVAGTSGTWFMTTSGGTIDVPAGSNGFAGTNRNEPPKLTSSPPVTPPAAPQPVGFTVADQLGAGGSSSLFPQMADGSGYGILHVSWDATMGSVSSTSATFAGGIGLDGFVDGAPQQVLRNTAALAEAGNDGIIGWGRWTNGQYLTGGSANSLSANQGLHYVVGLPTAAMPSTGSASYSLVGSTNPTGVSGAWAPGKFTLTSLSINFGTTNYLNVAFLVGIDGKTYNASTSAAPFTGNNFSTPLTVVNGGGGACGSGCSGSVAGMFYGDAAARLGINYKVIDDTNTITGAAAMTKK